VHIPEIIDNADFAETVPDREKLRSGLDSGSQKSVNSAKMFKKVFNNCKIAGLCK
jgi:hypothetical protein